MSTRTWVVLIVIFELVWLAYMAILLPVVFGLLLHETTAQLAPALRRLAVVIPIVLPVTAVALAFAIYDLVRRPVRAKAGWVLGFVFAGVFVLPVYFAVAVLPSRSGSAA